MHALLSFYVFHVFWFSLSFKIDFVFILLPPAPPTYSMLSVMLTVLWEKQVSTLTQFLILLPSVYLLLFVGILVNIFSPSIIKRYVI